MRDARITRRRALSWQRLKLAPASVPGAFQAPLFARARSLHLHLISACYAATGGPERGG